MANNVDKLQQAGVLHPENCTEEHRKAVESLSDAEVDALIQTHKKLADHLEPSDKAKEAGRPWVL